LTDCDVDAALEAAHLRPWQVANKASDGILLRRDVHALLDMGMMTIDRNFRVRFVSKTVGYYGEFEGRMLRPPKRKADRPRL
jgi:predicted restriction endonuclease